MCVAPYKSPSRYKYTQTWPIRAPTCCFIIGKVEQNATLLALARNIRRPLYVVGLGRWEVEFTFRETDKVRAHVGFLGVEVEITEEDSREVVLGIGGIVGKEETQNMGFRN